jgi:hypothetical protein
MKEMVENIAMKDISKGKAAIIMNYYEKERKERKTQSKYMFYCNSDICSLERRV